MTRTSMPRRTREERQEQRNQEWDWPYVVFFGVFVIVCGALAYAGLR